MPTDDKNDQQDFIGFTEDELKRQREPSTPSAGSETKRYHRKANRGQFDCVGMSLDDLVASDSVVRAIDVYVENLDLRALGFQNSDRGISRSAAVRSSILAAIISIRLHPQYSIGKTAGQGM